MLHSNPSYKYSIPTKVVIILLRGYQKFISPIFVLWSFLRHPAGCKFFPSCSEYTVEAIRQYGLLKGGVSSLKRILKCNPWNGGGYDPVTN